MRLNGIFGYSTKESGSSDISYIVKQKVQLNGFRASITIVHIRKFYELNRSIVQLRLCSRIAKRSLGEGECSVGSKPFKISV